jgi:hypothetical protein
MRLKMTEQSRRELADAIRPEYRKANFKRKTQLLQGFVLATGYNRKYATTLLSREPAKKRTRQRPKLYDQKVVSALVLCWEAANYICAKRLIPFLPVLVPSLQRNGRLQLDNETLTKLLTISAATADRIFSGERKERCKNPTLTKTGNLLRKHIEIRTFADWNESCPGFFEADTVGHHGGNIRGLYAYTLTMTDIATGWTELAGLRKKTEDEALHAIQSIQKSIPFTMLGIDTDNGSEFMNYGLISWCEDERITFTRSREYKKNDQCYVEEKNGSVVRKLVGHYRYASDKAFEALQSLYRFARLYVNYFQPSVKLKIKSRVGAKAKKQYDVAQTPFQRLLAFDMEEAQKLRLQAEFESLDPVLLLTEIRELQQVLLNEGHKPQRIEFAGPTSNVQVLPPGPREEPAKNSPVYKHSEKQSVLDKVWERFLALPEGATATRHTFSDLGESSTVNIAIRELVTQGLVEKIRWATYSRTYTAGPSKPRREGAGTSARIREYFLSNEGKTVTMKELLELGNPLTVRTIIRTLKRSGFIESCGWGQYRR